MTQSLFGFYLGMSFLTNHVGMPTLTGRRRAGIPAPAGLTSRNLSGRAMTGFLFGGLDTRSSTISSPPCPGPISGGPERWSARSVSSVGSTTPSRVPPARLGRGTGHLRRAGAGRPISVID